MSKYSYYTRSVITLLTRFERPGRILAIFLGLPGALPAEVRLRREGWRFLVREAMDVWVIKETCLDGDYAREATLRPDWQVVDVGAGLGDFTVYAAAHCPEGVVHAYEPLPASFELLEYNLKLNGLENARVFRQATGAAGRVVPTGEQDRPAVSTAFDASSAEAGVVSVTLAQILDRLPGSRCDLLKVDCEGCEYELLQGASPENRIVARGNENPDVSPAKPNGESK